MKRGLSGEEVVRGLNELEAAIKKRRAEVRWIFAEPDLEA